MKKLLLLMLCASMALLYVDSMAQTVIRGQTSGGSNLAADITSTRILKVMLYGNDGTNDQMLDTDSDGVLKVMEAYKNNAQWYWGTLFSLGRVRNGFVDSTAVWDNAGVYKHKYLEFATIPDTALTGVDSVVIYPMGSMDGQVYNVILSPTRFNLSASGYTDAALDTVRIVLKTTSAGDPTSGGTGFWIPFFDYRNGMPFIWNYMKFKIKNMAGKPVKVRIRAAGRMD